MALPELTSSTPENPAHLPPAIRLSCFLQFLRTNSLQRAVGSQKRLNISQAAVCQEINRVARIFAEKHEQFVKFPSIEESVLIAKEFEEEYGFPPVVTGIIDGTHIHITKPTTKDPLPERFYNRKGFYSINCMCVVDNKGKFIYFSARHCGSTHDAKAFNQSNLKARLVEQFDCDTPIALVGDEGYGCEDVLLTPVRQRQLEATTDPDLLEKMKNYNKALRKLRIKVEHAFGRLKKRFPALLYQLRCRKIENVQAIISAAIVLHNFLIDLNEPSFNQGKKIA